jgi:quinol monooxygenase YgiN
MGRVAVLAKIPAAAGKRDDLVKAMQAALETVQGEEGTTYYILHEDNKDETMLWMYELYTGKEALDAHMGTDAFKALGPVMAPFLGGRPELIFLNPVGGKGL